MSPSTESCQRGLYRERHRIRRTVAFFVAAYAAELLCGLHAPFDVTKMRRHLEMCPQEAGELTPFLRDGKWQHGRRRKVITIAVDEPGVECVTCEQ